MSVFRLPLRGRGLIQVLVLASRSGGQEKLEIFAETDTEFFLKAVNAQLTFTKDSAGRVTQVVIHHASGQDESGPKIR